jgi:ubiquitin C-terminal hydrolase
MADRKYITYDPVWAIQPNGFVNTGAICWWNSLLQGLLGLTAVNQVLMTLYQNGELDGNTLALAYVKLIQTAMTSEPAVRSQMISQSTAVLVKFLQRCGDAKRTVMRGGSQECADEGLILFLEMLKVKAVETLFTTTYRLEIVCPKCEKTISMKRDPQTQVTFHPASVYDENGQRTFNTQETFSKWFYYHPSEMPEYKCSECKETFTNLYRIERLVCVNEIFVIRFPKFYRKDLIWFPEVITFDRAGGGSFQFKLVSKIEHSGSMNSGHYWTHSLRKNPDGTITPVLANDSSVSAGTLVPSHSTFLLMYHMV